MKAILKAKQGKEPGALFTLAHQLRGKFKTDDIEAQARIDKEKKQITVETDALEREELNSFLENADIFHKGGFSVEYEVEEKLESSQGSKGKARYPADYGILIGKVKKLEQEKSEYESKMAGLEQELDKEKRDRLKERRASTLKLQQLEAKCEGLGNIESLDQEIIMRANTEWENLSHWYSDTLKSGGEMIDTSPEELETKCLNYVLPRESKEFKKIADAYEQAKLAEETAKNNPYISLDNKAKRVIKRGNELLREGEEISVVREEIDEKFSESEMRMFLTVEDDDALLALPFRYREQYHGLELSFLQRVYEHLKKMDLEYEQENYNGLLRLRVKSAKTRKRKRLAKTIISDNKDTFSRFGGDKKIYGLVIYE
jgi:hypothetical protein